MFFDSGIAGSGLGDVNVRFRMYLIVTVGIAAFGSVLFWRAQLLVGSDYVELPDHGKTVRKVRGAQAKLINTSKALNEIE